MHIHAGSSDVYRLAERLGEAGKGFKKQLDRAGREAADVIVSAVTDPVSTARYAPAGYERRLHQSLRTRIEVRIAVQRVVTVVVWAEGKKYRRDLPKINAGLLKHPVHGRTRPITDGSNARHPERIKGGRYNNPWVAQAIRPGIIDDPKAEAVPRAVRKFHDAAARVRDKIERG